MSRLIDACHRAIRIEPVRDRLGRHRTVARLRSSDDPLLTTVAEALEYRPTADELAWIGRVEAERRRLEASDDVLRTSQYDYTLDPADEQVFEEITVGEVCKRASRTRPAATFLFALLRLLRPARCLELGTAVGISAAYQAAALHLNGSGKLITIDASAARVDVARDVATRLELEAAVDFRRDRFQDALPSLLREEPVGYVFIDGDHEEAATIEYFELVHPALTDPRLVVFDDIKWSRGMARAWARLRDDERVRGAGEAHGMGFCFYR